VLSRGAGECLAASPAELAAMGCAASDTVQRVCNNERIVDARLVFRAQVASCGACYSLILASSRGKSRADIVEIDCKGRALSCV
jgi:hypothetical protein